jgi:hypothetical protein
MTPEYPNGTAKAVPLVYYLGQTKEDNIDQRVAPVGANGM